MQNISVIIVHYRTPELLKLCLARLKEHLEEIKHEVIVVDSEATRASRDVVSSSTGDAVRYLPFKQNIGFAKGVNIGLRATTGTYRLILNPDTLITKGSVQGMVAYMDQHEDIGILGPQLLYFNGEHQRSYHRLYRPITILVRRTFLQRYTPFRRLNDSFMMADTDPGKIQTPDWIMGAAMLVRGRALETVGLMDERYFLYFEDVDWCRRFWHNGYKVVYYPYARFYHYYPRASSRWGIIDILFNRRTRWHIASALKFFLKWTVDDISFRSSSSSPSR